MFSQFSHKNAFSPAIFPLRKTYYTATSILVNFYIKYKKRSTIFYMKSLDQIVWSHGVIQHFTDNLNAIDIQDNNTEFAIKV